MENKMTPDEKKMKFLLDNKLIISCGEGRRIIHATKESGKFEWFIKRKNPNLHFDENKEENK